MSKHLGPLPDLLSQNQHFNWIPRGLMHIHICVWITLPSNSAKTARKRTVNRISRTFTFPASPVACCTGLGPASSVGAGQCHYVTTSCKSTPAPCRTWLLVALPNTNQSALPQVKLLWRLKKIFFSF